jgi:hypothetical protein
VVKDGGVVVLVKAQQARVVAWSNERNVGDGEGARRGIRIQRR